MPKRIEQLGEELGLILQKKRKGRFLIDEKDRNNRLRQK